MHPMEQTIPIHLLIGPSGPLACHVIKSFMKANGTKPGVDTSRLALAHMGAGAAIQSAMRAHSENVVIQQQGKQALQLLWGVEGSH